MPYTENFVLRTVEDRVRARRLWAGLLLALFIIFVRFATFMKDEGGLAEEWIRTRVSEKLIVELQKAGNSTCPILCIRLSK